MACCPELNNEDYEFIKRRGKVFNWFCRLCKTTVADVLTNIEKFKKVNQELKATKDELDKKFLDLQKRMEKIEGSNSVSQEKIEKKIETIAAKNVNVQQVDLAEQQNIEKRRKNLIFFGIPESQNEDIETRLENDFNTINAALDQKTVIEREEITDLFRLGKKSEKPRPLILKFQDEEVILRYVY